MSSAEIANLLLVLVAIVAVVSTARRDCVRVLGHSARQNLPDHTPPVTIFKPLKGLDEELEENLRSFFQLDYPCYQLLFCVADADDPAIAVVRKLLGEFPDHDAQLVVGCPAFGLNPKVESLAAMDRHRKHDVILISDSNVRARPSYLRETACYLAEPGVGLVTNLFAGVGEVHPGAVLENLQLNGFIAGGRGGGGGVSGHLRGRQVDADAGAGAGGDRRVRGGSQRAGRGPGHRHAGPQGRLLDPPEPSRRSRTSTRAAASAGS